MLLASLCDQSLLFETLKEDYLEKGDKKPVMEITM